MHWLSWHCSDCVLCCHWSDHSADCSKFDASAAVLNGLCSGAVTYTSSSQISCTLLPTAGLTVAVTVTTTTGGSSATTGFTVSYAAAPVISSVDCGTGSGSLSIVNCPRGFGVLTVVGSNLVNPTVSSITSGVCSTALTVNGAGTELTCTLANAAAGTTVSNVQVTVNGGVSTPATGVTVAFASMPTLSTLAMTGCGGTGTTALTNCPIAAGGVITVSGTNLYFAAGGVTVTATGASCTWSVAGSAGSSILCTLSAAATAGPHLPSLALLPMVAASLA